MQNSSDMSSSTLIKRMINKFFELVSHIIACYNVGFMLIVVFTSGWSKSNT